MASPLDGSLVTIRSYSPEKVHTSKPVPIAIPDLKEHKVKHVFSAAVHAPIPRKANGNGIHFVEHLCASRTPSPSQKVDSPRALTPLPSPRALRTPSPSQKVDSPRASTPSPSPSALRTPSPAPVQKVAEFLPPIPPEIERQNQVLERILSPPRSHQKLSFTQIHAQRTPEELEVFQKFMDSFRYMQSYSDKVQARYNNKRKPIERNRLPYCEMEVDQEISALTEKPKMQRTSSAKERQAAENLHW